MGREDKGMITNEEVSAMEEWEDRMREIIQKTFHGVVKSKVSVVPSIDRRRIHVIYGKEHWVCWLNEGNGLFKSINGIMDDVVVKELKRRKRCSSSRKS